MIISATSPTTISLRHPTPIQLEIWDPVRKRWDTAAQTNTLTNEGVIITLTGLVPNTEYRVQCKGSEETVGVKTQAVINDTQTNVIRQQTDLFHYLNTNQAEQATRILEQNPAFNTECRDKNNQTPLMAAASNGCLEIARALIQRGADLESKSAAGKTPLSIATSENHIEIVKLLIESGAEVNAKDFGGSTPLLWAADHGHADVIAFLLSLPKLHATVADSNGLNAILRLLTASPNRGGGSLPCLEMLIKHISPTEANKFGQDALLIAALNRHLECLDYFLQLGVFDEDSWNKALLVAEGQNSVQVIEMLQNYPKGRKPKQKVEEKNPLDEAE